MRVSIDLTGNKYGRLTVLKRDGYLGNKEIAWKCLCRCGIAKRVMGVSLRRGRTKSCGCLSREMAATRIGDRQRIHGDGNATEYRSWYAMKRRCLDESDRSFEGYGGRGIAVCDRWLNSYENFLQDMGRKPSKSYSMDRIDNDGNYEPSNCRWGTAKEQANNRRTSVKVEFHGVELTIAEWSRKMNIKYSTLRARLFKHEWSVSDALTKPIGSTKQGLK